MRGGVGLVYFLNSSNAERGGGSRAPASPCLTTSITGGWTGTGTAKDQLKSATRQEAGMDKDLPPLPPPPAPSPDLNSTYALSERLNCA